MSSMLGGAGTGVDPGMAGVSGPAGPMQVPQGAGDMSGAQALNSPDATANMMGGAKGLFNIASMFGDTPEERSKNIRAFSGMVDQLGKFGKSVQDSTILQRMMKGRIRDIGVISSGQQSGGVGPIPEYGGGVAAPIMSNATFGGR
jgi:hypothetical protein